MHVLRLFLTRSSAATRGRAPTRRCIRVLASSEQPSLRLSKCLAPGSSDHLERTLTVLRWPPISEANLRLAFKSHSAPRPPQTPAASS